MRLFYFLQFVCCCLYVNFIGFYFLFEEFWIIIRITEWTGFTTYRRTFHLIHFVWKKYNRFFSSSGKIVYRLATTRRTYVGEIFTIFIFLQLFSLSWQEKCAVYNGNGMLNLILEFYWILCYLDCIWYDWIFDFEWWDDGNDNDAPFKRWGRRDDDNCCIWFDFVLFLFENGIEISLSFHFWICNSKQSLSELFYSFIAFQFQSICVNTNYTNWVNYVIYRWR